MKLNGSGDEDSPRSEQEGSGELPSAHQEVDKVLRSLDPGEHLCCISDSSAEYLKILSPYILGGLENNQKVLCVWDCHPQEEICSALRMEEVDLDRFVSSGQLVFLNFREAYLSEGVIDPHRLVHLLEEILADSISAGYSVLRTTGEMSWSLREQHDSDLLLQCETEVDLFRHDKSVISLCQYERHLFSDKTLLDIIRIHPRVIYRSELLENDFYCRPEQPVKETPPEAMLNVWIESLRERRERERRKLQEQAEQLEATVSRRTAALESEIQRRREVEAALRESEELYRALVNTAPVSVVLVEDGKYTFCNPKGSELLGFDSPSEVVGRDIFSAVSPESRPLVEARLKRIQESKSNQPIAIRLLRRDGSVRTVEYSSVPVTIAGKKAALVVAQDITDRTRDQARLRKAHARLQRSLQFTESLLNALPTPVFYKDREGKYLGCNRAFSEVMGVSAEELRGRTVEELWPESHAREYHEKDLELMQNRHQQTYDSEVVSADGSKLDVIFSKDVFYDEMGEVAGIVGAFLDVTERTRAADERRQLEVRIQEAQRLESLGVLAGGIAHDFNNLLMAVMGNLELARFDLDESHPAAELVTASYNAASQAVELVKQLLAYSGKGRMELETFDLSDVVHQISQMLRSSIPRKVQLELDLSSQLAPVEGDPRQIQQLVLNLTVNGAEAIGNESGVVTIRTRAEELESEPRHIVTADMQLPPGHYVVLEVGDTGCGVRKEDRERIFDPFYSTRFAGRGLGLPAVMGIVRGHGGGIAVDSTPGQGSTFTVYLPASEVNGESDGEKSLDQQTPLDGALVLLVDDEEGVRTLGARMLKRLGLKVLTAREGREALRIYAERQNEIGCVIVDLTMPRMDGIETAEELRKQDPEVRIILTSGHSAEQVTNQLVRETAFLQKPYRLEALKKKLPKVLE